MTQAHTLSMSNAVAALPRLLDNLEHILRKGEANASERDIDPAIYLNVRLAPDMWPLAKQVQTCAELAKNAPYRIAGLEAPDYSGHPESFQACYDLLDQARSDIAVVKAEELDGKEHRAFKLKMGPRGDVDFTGITYLSGFTLPNVYFHVTTVYNILRHNGVPLGKLDYFGGSS